MKFLKIAYVPLVIFFACQVAAQVQTPLHVEAFGGVHEPLPAITVPLELEPFLPKGFILRSEFKTRMSPEGETLFLYDNGEDTFPEVHLHALRNGKNLALFDGAVAGVAGLLPIKSPQGREIVVFAYHVGFDESDTTFVIFGAGDNLYQGIFEQKTTEGQMRILGNPPLQIEIWSADATLDQGESCVWCPHRYDVRTYLYRDGKFNMTSKLTTKMSLDPGSIAEKTFATRQDKKTE
jgi:hypothetical protein